MTNEQLAILLDGILYELSGALIEARDLIAADRPKVRRRVHVGGLMCPHIFGRCEIPEHWEEIEDNDPVSELAPLEAIVERLGERIDRLRPPPTISS